MRLPIAAEGRIFVAAPLGGALLALGAGGVLGMASLSWAGGALLLGSGFCAFFFRDPERVPPAEEGDLLLAPADGRVTEVGPAGEGEPGNQRVSIFLSLFDVHVNRAPAAGQVSAVRYREGAFRAAFRKDAAQRNERNELELNTERGPVRVRQIAGVAARRIVCRARVGDRLNAGERFGLIRFGSRTDVVVPPGVSWRVRRGDHVRGGVTVLGKWR